MVTIAIKKFVAIVLVVSIVSLVPLQILAQIEPQITYGEWCAHLAELHAQQQVKQEVSTIKVGPYLCPYLWSILLIAGGVWSYGQVDFDMAIGSWLLTAGIVLSVLPSYQIGQKIDEVKAIERTIADVQREIDLWEQAGAAHMWFYPCE